MKFQACRFKRTKNGKWEAGVAVLKIFDLSDVNNIIDSNGKLVGKKLYTYELAITADRAYHSIDLSVVILPEKYVPSDNG